MNATKPDHTYSVLSRRNLLSVGNLIMFIFREKRLLVFLGLFFVVTGSGTGSGDYEGE